MKRSPDAYAVRLTVALDTYQACQPRSLQTEIGVSSVGHCRSEALYRLTGVAETDMPAARKSQHGTMLHAGYSAAMAWYDPSLIIEPELKVTLPSGLILIGHPDWIDPNEPSVTDLKGLACDTPVPTPGGWTKMAWLGIGDTVFDKDGRPTRVTAVSEVKHLDCYRVLFANGHSLVCDSEHIWHARIGDGSVGNYPIAELAAARAAGIKVMIPVAGELDLPAVDLPVDPYLLGYWLGNGNRNEPNLTAHGDDAAELVGILRALGYDCGDPRFDKRGSNTAAFRVRGVRKVFADAGLFGAKRIPAAYLRASVAQRKALLRGLMDSDGSPNIARGRVVFAVTEEALRDDVLELVVGLGLRPQVYDFPTHGYGKDVISRGLEWTPMFVPFALTRKRERCRPLGPKQGAKAAWHRVVLIEQVESVPTRCIAVDSPSQTYLAGRRMVPTHNTKDDEAAVYAQRRGGSSEQQNMQRHLYGLGAIQAGLVPAEGLIVRNVWVDRAGQGSEPYVEQEPFDMAIVHAADSWLSDLTYAAEHGEEVPKDKHFSWCVKFCEFASVCRKDDLPELVVTDADMVNAMADLHEGRATSKAGDLLEKAAKVALAPLQQNADGDVGAFTGVDADGKEAWRLRWIWINGGENRAGYWKADIQKVSP